MYQTHWGLQSKPFEPTADARFYYPGESQQGALLKLRYAVENRRPAALLTAAAGIGKTMLVEALLKQLGDEVQPRVQIVFPLLTPAQLVSDIANRLTGESYSAGDAAELAIRRLERQLEFLAQSNRHALIVIDEAQTLVETGGLEALRLLLNFETNARHAATFLLVGQTDLLLAVERFSALEERLSVKCQLRRFAQAETMAYIQHRLLAAGAAQSPFDDQALETIHRRTQGVARRINRLCDLALLVGYAEGAEAIHSEQIDAVAADLLPVADA